MKFSNYLGIRDVKDLIVKKYNQDLMDIRQWWDEHNSGSRTWDNLVATTATITNATITNLTTGQSAIQFVTTSQASTSSVSYQSSNLQSSITPTSASKRIKVTASWGFQIPAVAGATLAICLFRGSTNVTGSGDMIVIDNPSSAVVFKSGWSFTFIDSPATTSATGYTVKFRSISGDTVKLPSDNLEQGTLVLEEIV